MPADTLWPIWKRNLAICWLGGFITNAGMTMVLPFIPLYLEQLGLHREADVEQWAGVAFGATFLMAAIVSPLWGRLADQYGRKLMLIRASLGMSVITTLMGFVTQPWHLVALRFLMGAVSGYVSASTTLIATQTPKERSGWALAVVTTGAIAGGLIGPLLGGYLSEVIGLRKVFWATGGLIFLSFLLTAGLIRETFERRNTAPLTGREVWGAIGRPKLVLGMFVTAGLMQAGAISIEPVVTIYVRQLLGRADHVALVAGLVVASAGLATVIAAPILGRCSDRFGPWRVLGLSLLVAGLTLIPQGWVHEAWQLGLWRFGFGLASAGLLPAVNSVIRSLTPEHALGRIYGYTQSGQYLGNLAGPVLGGLVAAHWGIPMLFLLTALVLIANAGWVAVQASRIAGGGRPEPVPTATVAGS
jgi:MFS family permease